MAVNAGDSGLVGPLARARRVMQETPEPGWAAIEKRVVAAVRDTPRGGWPLRVVDPDPDAAPGSIVVTDRAVKASLIHVLRADPDFAVGAIDVVADEMTFVAMRVELTGRYDADLNAVARRVLAVCTRVLDEVIGDAASIPIEVVVTDVHR